MTATEAPSEDAADTASSRVAARGLVGAVVLVVVAVAVPRLLGWEVWARTETGRFGTTAPLSYYPAPDWWGIGTVPTIALAVAGVAHGPRVAQTLAWGRLLVVSALVSGGWMLALTVLSGTDGLSDPLAHSAGYFETAYDVAHGTEGVGVQEALDGWVGRIPLDSRDNWPVHVAGHPPGALLVFVVMIRLGLDTTTTAALAVIAIASTIAPAVLVTLRRLGAEQAARTVAPYLVLIPAAVFLAVTADAVFAAVAAWGIAALAAAATAERRPSRLALGAVAGLMLGFCVFLSYGLPLLGVLAIAVLVAARGWWDPLPVAVLAALLVAAAFAVAGFSWWEAYPVLSDRYWDGLASRRPGAYWTWANLAALLASGGLVLGSGVALLGVAVRRGALRAPEADRRAVAWLAGAGVVMVLLATSSQMSRAEVERIWLPFVPWLTLSLVLLPPRWRTPALALQVVTAVVIETVFLTY